MVEELIPFIRTNEFIFIIIFKIIDRITGKRMKRLLKVSLLILVMFASSSMTWRRMDYKEGMYKNVCKNLANEVLLYFIFVDSKETAPWTEFDIQSTIDSLAVAIDWLHKQARKNNIPLNIKSDYYIGEEYTTIRRELPNGSVQNSVIDPNLRKGLEELNKWSDNVAKRAGTSFNIPERDGIPEINNPRNKERLIAYLRDEYSVESVALLFMVNNYYKTDISLAVNTLTTEDVEFAIVSYKYPSDIAHNFLHLYGAADLYETPFRRNDKKIELARQYFSNDIMQDPYAKKIQSLEIGAFTKYLIGWTDELDHQYKPLLTDKIINY